jgi:hypothetical protein
LDQRTVTPAAVTFVDATCDALGTYTIPEFEGVEYYKDKEVVAAGTYDVDEDMTLVVSAEVMETYFLDEGAVVEWTNEFVTPTDCDEDTPAVLAAVTPTPQVTATPVGAANAGGAGSTALVGLVASSAVLGLGVATKKFLA